MREVLPALCLICLAAAVVNSCQQQKPFVASPVTRVYLSNEGGNYSSFAVDGRFLLVGGKEQVYRIPLSDSGSQTTISSPPLSAFATSVRECQRRERTNAAAKCKNYIRILNAHDKEIYTCGTGAGKPLEITLHNSNLSIKENRGQDSGQGKCVGDPAKDMTSLFVRSGNPANQPALYVGTYLNQGNRPMILRTKYTGADGFEYPRVFTVTPEQNLAEWLDDPHFIASYDSGSHVHFFFREANGEAKIARICKNDRGGNYELENRWTTYQKAALKCSVPGDETFNFTELRGVFKLHTNYYALFTTKVKNPSLHGHSVVSAVCIYTEASVAAAFIGPYYERAVAVGASDQNQLNVPTDDKRQSGGCTAESLTSQTERFIKDNPFMLNPVQPLGGKPTCLQRDVTFTHIAVESVQAQFNVMYLATDEGRLYKIIMYNDFNTVKGIAVWTPFADKATSVQNMLLQNEQLFLATDENVVKVGVRQCSLYTVCSQCVSDPHCAWDTLSPRPHCTSFNSDALRYRFGVKSPFSTCRDACKVSASLVTVSVRVHGDPIHLTCNNYCKPPSESIRWMKGSRLLPDDQSKFVRTAANGLVVLNSTQADTGSYSCVSFVDNQSAVLAEYSVILPKCSRGDTECEWKDQYRTWCNEFERYRKEFDNWVCLKKSCQNQCSNSIQQCSRP